MWWCCYETCDPQAVKKYEAAMSINDSELNASLVTKYEAALATAYVTKSSGCLLELLVSKSEDKKLRQAVQQELKDLRAHVGKGKAEQRLLPVLRERAERVLEGSS